MSFLGLRWRGRGLGVASGGETGGVGVEEKRDEVEGVECGGDGGRVRGIGGKS